MTWDINITKPCALDLSTAASFWDEKKADLKPTRPTGLLYAPRKKIN